jgi:hypothetical protein
MDGGEMQVSHYKIHLKLPLLKDETVIVQEIESHALERVVRWRLSQAIAKRGYKWSQVQDWYLVLEKVIPCPRT